MAVKKIDSIMGEFAKTLNAGVSDSDTDREQIEYIDIDLLDDDPRNFYVLSGIDELASNIQVCGLQQPIRVRAGETGRYTIVSGHRRRAALRKLVQDGLEQYRQVPCIPEREDISPAMQELRLIWANSDTRKLSSAEMSRQVERVTALLYQLKEEGYEFPGRMQEHVAEACKISKTKVANLKTIRENLTPKWKHLWEKNQINESLALTVARMPEKHQDLCFENKKVCNDKRYGYYESQAKADGERLARLEKLKCPKTKELCENRTRKWEHLMPVSSWSDESCSKKCCGECSDLGSCKKACPMFSDKIKEIRAERREERRQEKMAQEAKDLPKIRKIQELWLRFGVAREAAGKSVKQVCRTMNRFYSTSGTDQEFKELEDNTAKEDPNTNLPYGNYFHLSQAESLIHAADLLGCSVDYLLCRTDDPNGGAAPPAQPEGQLAICGWMPGGTNPGESGWCVCMMALDPAKPMPKALWWDGAAWKFRPGGADAAGLEPLAWMRLPEYEGGEQHD